MERPEIKHKRIELCLAIEKRFRFSGPVDWLADSFAPPLNSHSIRMLKNLLTNWYWSCTVRDHGPETEKRKCLQKKPEKQLYITPIIGSGAVRLISIKFPVCALWKDLWTLLELLCFYSRDVSLFYRYFGWGRQHHLQVARDVFSATSLKRFSLTIERLLCNCIISVISLKKHDHLVQ